MTGVEQQNTAKLNIYILLIFFDWADRQRSKRFGDGMHFDPRMLRGLSEASESHFSVGQTSALAAVENGVLVFWHFDK